MMLIITFATATEVDNCMSCGVYFQDNWDDEDTEEKNEEQKGGKLKKLLCLIMSVIKQQYDLLYLTHTSCLTLKIYC